ncbi:hypothetical protein JNUCC0626_47980 [Lentzea sp. JNUCC 0626]|uniref:hypothetical protein n=1 Tax=Lentzea sp. JNUCC 0626 TaxID=3367513 RepID=UPI003748BDD9
MELMMKNSARRVAVSTLVAAAFIGVAVTPAQAAVLWEVSGPVRTSAQVAFDEDIPPLEAKCRRDDGVPKSRVTGVEGQPRYWATVTCNSKRV